VGAMANSGSHRPGPSCEHGLCAIPTPGSGAIGKETSWGKSSGNEPDLPQEVSGYLASGANCNHCRGSTARPLTCSSQCRCGPVLKPVLPTSPNC
jgi:hypothetical protein